MVTKFPIFILVFSFTLMILCLIHLCKQDSTRFLTKLLWAFIIVCGSMLGQIAYLALEVFHIDIY